MVSTQWIASSSFLKKYNRPAAGDAGTAISFIPPGWKKKSLDIKARITVKAGFE